MRVCPVRTDGCVRGTPALRRAVEIELPIVIRLFGPLILAPRMRFTYPVVVKTVKMSFWLWAPSWPHDGTIFRPWALVGRFWVVLGAFLLLAQSFIDFGSISERFGEGLGRPKLSIFSFCSMFFRSIFRTTFWKANKSRKITQHRYINRFLGRPGGMRGLLGREMGGVQKA